MLHSKLLTMRLGATSIISSANRWQFVIETSANGSISAASCNQRRNHHILKAQPTINFSEIRHANERSYSICSKKHSTVSIFQAGHSEPVNGNRALKERPN